MAISTATLANPNFTSGDETHDYKLFCDYLEKHCGITLGQNKGYLINSRLKSIKEHHHLNSLSDIVHAMESSADKTLKTEVIDAMTTNETSWFRDRYPFEVLQSEMFAAISKTPHTPKIWSAASSCGHEPYSISIVFQEYLDKHPGQFTRGLDILGTDISRKSLEIARSAEYDEIAMARGMSPERKQKYFRETANGMLLADNIKNRVRFQEFNLLNSYSLLGRFDIIFCRNVLIYFSNENKSQILNKMADVLQPDGYLFLGASEPIVNYCDSFEMVSNNQIVYYRRK